MTNTNIVRVTKAQKYEAIKTIIEQVADSFEPVVFEAPQDKDGNKTKEDAVIDAQAIIEFCDAEIALLSRKTNGEKKMTDRQKENEELKVIIMNYLGTQTEGKTCTDLNKEIPELNDLNNQRIARLMNSLYNDGAGVVSKETIKGKSYFRIA